MVWEVGDAGVKFASGRTQPDAADVNPAFSAYQSTLQTFSSGTLAKVIFQSEDFDTGNVYDATTGRFQPNVAGYYFLEATVAMYAVNGENGVFALFYKNGAGALHGLQTKFRTSVSGMIYLNGTTDYVEVFVLQQDGVNRDSTPNTGAAKPTHFSGFLARLP